MMLSEIITKDLNLVYNRTKLFDSNIEETIELIKSGEDVNAVEEHMGQSPLHIACVRGVHKTSLLLENGADVNKIDGNGKTPLFYAGFEESMILLKEGAYVDRIEFFHGRTPLFGCNLDDSEVSSIDVEKSRLLIEHGADVNHQDDYGKTALFYADTKNTSLLLQNGADVNKEDYSGVTPLENELFRDRHDKVKILLAYIFS